MPNGIYLSGANCLEFKYFRDDSSESVVMPSVNMVTVTITALHLILIPIPRSFL